MKKTALLLLLLTSFLGVKAQKEYNLKYDTIGIGYPDNSSGVALYGDIYLKNVTEGLIRLNSDRKFVTTTLTESDIPSLPISKVTGLGDSLTKKINNQKAYDQPGNIRINGSISAGDENVIQSNLTVLGDTIRNGATFGRYNRVYSWDNFAAGTGNWADGKIASATGNTNIASSNDSYVSGNRNVVGRKQFDITSQGVDDPGLGVGNRAYVVIDPIEGDVTGYFPNATKDGDTAYIDSTYQSGYTIVGGFVNNPADPDPKWAMPPYMIIRNANWETDITLKKVLKADYNSVTGTKIYYDTTASAYTTISRVYGSYAPTVYVNGVQGGNGLHGEGYLTSAWGYGAHAEGYFTRSWGFGSHAQGYYSWADGFGSHAQNVRTRASGYGSSAFGIGSLAESYGTTAGGAWNVGGGTSDTWVATDPLFELGKGTSDTTRANAFQVLKNGNTRIDGVDIPLSINSSTDYTQIDFLNNNTQKAAIYWDETTDKLNYYSSANTHRFNRTIEGVQGAIFSADVFTLPDSYSSAWDNNDAVPTKNAVYDKIQTITGSSDTSGVYTPTCTSKTNIATVTPSPFMFTREGNFVTVYGVLECTTTATGNSEIYITLPIASTFTGWEDALGHGNTQNGGATDIVVNNENGGDKAILDFSASVTTTKVIYFSFRYKVI